MAASIHAHIITQNNTTALKFMPGSTLQAAEGGDVRSFSSRGSTLCRFVSMQLTPNYYIFTRRKSGAVNSSHAASRVT